MKNSLKLSVLLLASVALSACINDLDTKPIDKNSSTSFNQERIFTKCYATLATTGQQGPTGNGDVEDIDEGTSSFYRTIWYMNTIPTDEGWWIWEDAGVPELRTQVWTGDNVLVNGIYARLNMDIKYCNHYITYASADNDEDQYRMAEVRFIRALNYYYLMDLFLYAPLCTEESSDFPHYKSRAELYKWLVDELKDLTTKLSDSRSADRKYRVGKAAAYQLLARTYLNADVYNQFNKSWTAKSALPSAIDAAQQAINCGYSLYETKITTDSGFVYTAFQQLFMADNHRDAVANEFPLLIYQDGVFCRNYGGARFLTDATRIAGMTAWGTEDKWGCYRTSPTMVRMFTRRAGIDEHSIEAIKANEYDMPAQLKDDRAILCSHTDGLDKKWLFTGTQRIKDESYFLDCWAAPKFNNISSSAPKPSMWKGSDNSWADTDIPFLRIAEAYMIKAEALFRQGNTEEARTIINDVIRRRANADPISAADFTEEELLSEWGREFMGEGRRRMDLVRFGRFFGTKADANQYNWEGRLGVNDNGTFKAGGPEYLNWFPVPSDDKKVNPNFATEVEGDANNPYASQGGDGYIYQK